MRWVTKHVARFLQVCVNGKGGAKDGQTCRCARSMLRRGRRNLATREVERLEERMLLATVGEENGVLHYEAAGGEANNLMVFESPGQFLFNDSGAGIVVGAGCSSLSTHQASCSAAGVTRLDIDLRDQDDIVWLDSGIAAIIRGRGGNDTITAGRGDDTIIGGDGDDLLFGADGNDSLRGGDAPDTLYGGDGNDRLDGGDAVDGLNGGAGQDTLVHAQQDQLIADPDPADLTFTRMIDTPDPVGIGGYLAYEITIKIALHDAGTVARRASEGAHGEITRNQARSLAGASGYA